MTGMSAVPTTAAQNAAEPLTVARTLAGRIALPLVFRRRDHVPRPPVPRPRHGDGVQRRAAVREALAGDRRRTRPLDPRRAHLLPRPALVARAGTRLAARLDAERLRGRQDPERRRDVGRGLSRVLARAPARSAVVRDPDRDRSRDDAGARLPRLPDVGGARVPGVPRHRRRAPARGHEAVARQWLSPSRSSACSPSRPESSSSPCRSRTSPRSRSAVAATIAGISCRSALTAALRRTGRRRPGRARTVRRGDAPRLCPARRRALGPRRRVAPAVLASASRS